MARQKVTLSLTIEAVEALANHATERKRGEFVSGLILDFDRNAGLQLDTEYKPPQPLESMVQEMSIRLSRIERLLEEKLG